MFKYVVLYIPLQRINHIHRIGRTEMVSQSHLHTEPAMMSSARTEGRAHNSTPG